jgi:hypothetical protein
VRVAQLVTQMEAGGAQRVAELLGEGLRARGHEAELWFMYIKRPTHVALPGVRIVTNQCPTGSDVGAVAARLWQMLQDYRPDAFISHTHYANVIGQFVARLAGIRRRLAVQHNGLDTYPSLVRWADALLGSTGFYTQNVAI